MAEHSSGTLVITIVTSVNMITLQVIAVRVLLHLHSGDVVEANQVFSEALR